MCASLHHSGEWAFCVWSNAIVSFSFLFVFLSFGSNHHNFISCQTHLGPLGRRFGHINPLFLLLPSLQSFMVNPFQLHGGEIPQKLPWITVMTLFRSCHLIGFVVNCEQRQHPSRLSDYSKLIPEPCNLPMTSTISNTFDIWSANNTSWIFLIL